MRLARFLLFTWLGFGSSLWLSNSLD
jgi:hypothetical protein